MQHLKPIQFSFFFNKREKQDPERESELLA